MNIDVVYVRNLEVGDLYAGWVARNAPTRPVQPCAHAMTVHHISEVPAAVYTLHFSEDLSLTSGPLKGHDQVLVIRPDQPACTGAADLCGAAAGEPCKPGCPSLATNEANR